jgi:hypothetical protein
MQSFFSVCVLILFAFSTVSAQFMTEITTKRPNNFTEWEIYTEKEEDFPTGELRWQYNMQGDFSDWEYDVERNNGSIRLKWKNDPTQWEFRGDGTLIHARIIYPNDFTEWRITDNVMSTYRNDLSEWRVEDEQYGKFLIRVKYQNDARTWEIFDELSKEIPFTMKMAMVFTAVYHSVPKR